MTLSTIISMLIGTGIPALVLLITKETITPKVKALLVLFLTTASGVLSSLVGSIPSTWAQWQHVILNLLMTYMTAAVADVAGWRTGASKKLESVTKDFGIG